MELLVARQPIFDSNKKIVAYELLHREAGQTSFTQTDGDYATSNVIASSFLSLGIQSLTSGKQAFINFTGDLLLSGVVTLLPNDQLVVELLEDIDPSPEIIAACRALKDAGYVLALDDFVLRPDYRELISLADIIKVDFRLSDVADQARIIADLKKPGLRFLAEKVETEQEYLHAVHLGYELFQGYFFSRPTIISTGAVPINKIGYLRLMEALNTEEPNMKEIASAIESDVGLSLETVKLVNSAYFMRKQRIKNIQQAVVMLGLDGVRKWVYLTALRKMGDSLTPDVLIHTSLVRSKFMELFAGCIGEPGRAREFTLLGLFSLLDAITRQSFAKLLENINLTDEIKTVLVEGRCDSTLGRAYLLMCAYERGEWQKAIDLCETFAIKMDEAAMAYVNSLEWFNTNYLAYA